MQMARVIGDVVATVKDAALQSHKLLVLQPINLDREPAGRTLVALDAVGAGVGEHVFFVRGKEASFPFLPAEPPADACVVGIVDHWDVEGAPTRR
jgi:ethanolamine utilization protein EutN